MQFTIRQYMFSCVKFTLIVLGSCFAIAIAYGASKVTTFDKPRIVFVIDDIGINKEFGHEALQLDKRVALAFLPYGKYTLYLSQLAKQKGHEVLVHMPMEPLNPKINPGPDALYLNADKSEISQKVIQNINNVYQPTGVNTHMGSKFSADQEYMRIVIDIIKQNDLYFMDSVTTKHTQGLMQAKRAGLVHLRRDVFLDNIKTDKAIKKQMDVAKTKARKDGYAVIVAHPFTKSFTHIKNEIVSLEAQGFQVITIPQLLEYFLEQQITIKGPQIIK